MASAISGVIIAIGLASMASMIAIVARTNRRQTRFEISDFGFGICFGFRVSNSKFPGR